MRRRVVNRMYITERIISIAIYLLLSLFVIVGIAKSGRDYKKIKRWMIFYVISLCILSYFYIPAETSDLTRLRELVNTTYSNMSFDKYLQMLGETSTYTTHTYYYIVARIGVTELISVLSCFINYSIICYVLYDYGKRNNIRGSSIAKALLLYVSIGGYLEVVSGFRSMCAFSLLFLCIYREFFQGKRVSTNLLLYFISIGFHNAVVPLVFFRFVFLLFQKEEHLVRRIFNYVVVIVLAIIMVRFGSTIIEATTTKAQTYLDNEIFSYFWTYLSSAITVLMEIYFLFVNRKIINNKVQKSYTIFFILFAILDLVSISLDYSIFRRYSRVLVMLSLPLVMESFDANLASGNRYVIKKQNLIYYILLFSVLFIEVVRGDLCGLKFFIM